MGTGVASGGAAPAPAGHSDLHHPLPLAAAGIGSEDTHCPGLSRPGTITSLRDSEKCGCCGSPAAGNGSAPWRGCWRLEFSGPGPWLSLRLGCGSSPLPCGANPRHRLEPFPEQSSAPPAMALLVRPRASPWRSPACGPGGPFRAGTSHRGRRTGTGLTPAAGSGRSAPGYRGPGRCG